MNSKRKTMKLFTLSILSILLLVGCSTMSLDEKNSQRAEIDKMAMQTIATLIKEDPSIQKNLDTAVAYAVINWKVTKIPLVGAGGGNGLIVNKKTGKHTYVNVSRFDIGGGWGVRSFKNLIIIHNQKTLDAGKDGIWKFAGGAEVAVGTASIEGDHQVNKQDTTTHMLLDGGGSATATIRVLHMSINSDLN